MRHKVGAHKVYRITLINYLPVLKSNCIYLDSETTIKIQQFQLSKNTVIKAKYRNTYCNKSTVYTVSPVPHQKPKALMVIACSMNYVDYNDV